MGFQLAIATLAGLTAGLYLEPVRFPAALVVAAGAAVLAALSAAVRWLALSLAVGLVAASWSSIVIAQRLAAAPEFPAGTIAVVRGYVADEPIERDRRTDVLVHVTSRRHDLTWEALDTLVVARVDAGVPVTFGSDVEIAGEVRTPRSTAERQFAERQRRLGVMAVLERVRFSDLGTWSGHPGVGALVAIRQELDAALGRSLPEPEAALASGILVGERSDIPDELRNTFNRVGVTHLIAISGYNVSIVVALLVTALRYGLGRRTALFLAIPGIAVYCLLVGGSPSVVRAGAMGGFALFGLLFGRDAHVWTLLALGCAGIAIVEPAILLDAGFQLSALATAGVFAATSTTDWAISSLPARLAFLGRPQLRPFAGFGRVLLAMLSVAVWVTVATAPVLAASFGQVSVVAPLSNVLLEPAMPVIMSTTAVVSLAGGIWPPLGSALAWLALPWLRYFIWIAQAIDRTGLASLGAGSLSPFAIAWWYGVVALGGLLLDRRRDFGPLSAIVRGTAGWLWRRPLWQSAPPLAVLTIAIWTQGLAFGSDASCVTFLDVPGDAALLSTGGRQILVDGGSSPSVLRAAMARALPFGARRIDLLIVTAVDDVHTGGLRDLARSYEISAVAVPPGHESALAGILGGPLPARSRLFEASAGQRWTIGDNEIEVLAVSDSEDEHPGRSLVAIRGSAQTVLLASAVEAADVSRAAGDAIDVQADVVRVPAPGRNGGRQWTEARTLVAPVLEVVRPAPGGGGVQAAGPVHRLGQDGTLTIWLDRPPDAGWTVVR